jgi:hypothetical protein
MSIWESVDAPTETFNKCFWKNVEFKSTCKTRKSGISEVSLTRLDERFGSTKLIVIDAHVFLSHLTFPLDGELSLTDRDSGQRQI